MEDAGGGEPGEIVAKGEWQPILTPDDTAQLTSVLGDPARTTRRTVRRYLLSGGLLRCSICEAPLVARPRGDGKRRYRGPRRRDRRGTAGADATVEAC